MDFRLESALAAKVEQWSTQTGRPVGDLLEDAVAGYFDELSELRTTLDRRYDEIVGGKVKPMGGREAYRLLKERAAERRKSIA
jgi:hypothetical protein